MFLLFENIDHRQGHNDRNPEFEKLGDEIEVAFKIGRIHDRDDRVRASDPCDTPGQHVAGDMFVQRRRIKAVKARQVDQVGRQVAGLPHALFALDGDARIICDLLFKAGKRIEESCFAGVRVSGKCDS